MTHNLGSYEHNLVSYGPFNADIFFSEKDKYIVITRDGKTIENDCIKKNEKSIVYPVAVCFKNPKGAETLLTFTKNGCFLLSEPSFSDLFMKRKKN